jgi:hypothetical protein
MHLALPAVGARMIRPGWCGVGLASGRTELVGKLDDDALSALLSDPRYPGEGDQILGGHGPPQLVGGVDSQHGLGQPRSDSAGRLKQLEHVPLVFVGETEEGE